MGIKIPSPEYDARLLAAPMYEFKESVRTDDPHSSAMPLVEVEHPHLTKAGRKALAELFAQSPALLVAGNKLHDALEDIQYLLEHGEDEEENELLQTLSEARSAWAALAAPLKQKG